MSLAVRVKTLVKVVVAAKELAPSPQVIKPREIRISPGAIVLLTVDT
jgi:hypothetical protein